MVVLVAVVVGVVVAVVVMHGRGGGDHGCSGGQGW